MEVVTFMIAGMLGLIALMRTPRISAPQLAGAVPLPWSGPEEEDEDQRPETDRAPSLPRGLIWAVSSLGLVRVVAFFAFGA